MARRVWQISSALFDLILSGIALVYLYPSVHVVETVSKTFGSMLDVAAEHRMEVG